MPVLVRVTGAIMEENGRIMIAKRKSGSHLAGKWEFPGGKIEAGESPEDCLKREIKEELAITVRVGAFLGSSIYHYDHLSIELLAYRVYWEAGDLRIRTHECVEWVPISRLVEYDFAPADVPIVEKLKNGFKERL